MNIHLFSLPCLDCIEYHTSYRGRQNNIAKVEDVETLELCQTFCAAHPDCSFFRYSVKHRDCALRSGQVGARVPREDVVSGLCPCIPSPDDEMQPPGMTTGGPVGV